MVSVAALALAGTLAVACGGDDDDDDNPSTGGRGGSGGSAGTGGGSGTGGGGTGGGAGSGGAAGSGGGSTLPLPPTDVAGLQTALNAGNYLPEVKAEKWACSNEQIGNINLGEATSKAHAFDENRDPVDAAPARNCANFSLAGLEFKADTDGGNAAGWPIGAAALKETLDASDNVIEIAYFALKPDLTWFFATATPAQGEDLQPAGPGRNYEVTAGQGCASCHTGPDVVTFGNSVPRTDDLADPNPYEPLFDSTAGAAGGARRESPRPPPTRVGRGRRALWPDGEGWFRYLPGDRGRDGKCLRASPYRGKGVFLAIEGPLLGLERRSGGFGPAAGRGPHD
ncbi:MAG TPA: hypothetical protein VFS43_46105 [Polyangiaceae bacterium]|nr:hypothetical protein [Polyangiaceae bacterium]